MKNKLSITIISVLAVIAIGLGIALGITYTSRYSAGTQAGYGEGAKAGYSKGAKEEKSKKIESVKNDRHKGVVPDLVGQNAKQASYWPAYDGSLPRIAIDSNDVVTLLARFKTPDGEEITKDNANKYKVVSQTPKAGTVFDISYAKDSSGKEYDNLVSDTGIDSITLTLEKVK